MMNKITITPKQFNSFKEIVEVGRFSQGYYKYLEDNETCRNIILAPVSNTKNEELYLYWEGEGQVIPGGSAFYSYFESNGFEVIKNAHPSLLINAMAELTEDRLMDLNIPPYVSIVLPTSEDTSFPSDFGHSCFLWANRSEYNRKLSLVNVGGKWYQLCAFLLHKKRDNVQEEPLEYSDSQIDSKISIGLENAFKLVKDNGYKIFKEV